MQLFIGCLEDGIRTEPTHVADIDSKKGRLLIKLS